ncbi:hypothetical protein, partial [Pseudomonas syringae]|uniref:hypothetical protein n=1 Tax=Pseudomonas syringae TaxID=317 RepID=UPI0019D6C1F2
REIHLLILELRMNRDLLMSGQLCQQILNLDAAIDQQTAPVTITTLSSKRTDSLIAGSMPQKDVAMSVVHALHSHNQHLLC